MGVIQCPVAIALLYAFQCIAMVLKGLHSCNDGGQKRFRQLLRMYSVRSSRSRVIGMLQALEKGAWHGPPPLGI